ncbi:MAG: hypothetical protein R3F56_13695 [Planctomycetota bacterium]
MRLDFNLSGVLSGMLAICSLPAQIQLTNASGGGERQPVLSADGRLVAYVAVSAGVRDLFTVTLPPTAPVRRTTNADVRIGGTTVFDAWPSLSIADDGSRAVYWNAGGVHVIDLGSNADAIVAPANLLPYPQISGDGSRVVFQDLVAGDHEVFVVAAGGGTPTQITNSSGVGRRLPHIRGNRVVFQKLVAGFEEVFLHDLATSTTTGPLSTNSGRGNRYARLTPDGRQIVYEALVAGAVKEVFVYDIATAATQQISSNSLRGDRMAVPSLDGEAFYELSAVNREIQRVELNGSAQTAMTSSTSAGYRRISVDRHGSIAVFQAEASGTTEVFATVAAWPPLLSHYGQHGVPSIGTLQETDIVYRRTHSFGIDTGLASGTPATLLLGFGQLAVPLPNAPGNFLYVTPAVTVPLGLDANGDAAVVVNSPTTLSGASVFGQWALLDPPANGLGVVSSKGVRTAFR